MSMQMRGVLFWNPSEVADFPRLGPQNYPPRPSSDGLFEWLERVLVRFSRVLRAWSGGDYSLHVLLVFSLCLLSSLHVLQVFLMAFVRC